MQVDFHHPVYTIKSFSIYSSSLMKVLMLELAQVRGRTSCVSWGALASLTLRFLSALPKPDVLTFVLPGYHTASVSCYYTVGDRSRTILSRASVVDYE